MGNNFDLAFSETVKQIQIRKGSRSGYAKMAAGDDKWDTLPDELAEFIQQRNSFYLGTSNADGQPYIQHRGGPAGFLHVLDNRTLAFADFKGNKQYISQGNLSDNPKAFIFLMDYLMPRRLKIWGEARVVENDEALISQLMRSDYKARPEQVIIFDVKLWNLNCHQHIPRLVDMLEVVDEIKERDRRIAELENEISRLKSQLARD